MGLLNNLENIGIQGYLLLRIKKYLKERKQRVVKKPHILRRVWRYIEEEHKTMAKRKGTKGQTPIEIKLKIE